MSDPVRDLAAAIVGALGAAPLQGLTGFVESDDGGGTVTVDLGGATPVPGIPRAASYTSPTNGDRVLVVLVDGSPWVICKSAVS